MTAKKIKEKRRERKKQKARRAKVLTGYKNKTKNVLTRKKVNTLIKLVDELYELASEEGVFVFTPSKNNNPNRYWGALVCPECGELYCFLDEDRTEKFCRDCKFDPIKLNDKYPPIFSNEEEMVIIEKGGVPPIHGCRKAQDRLRRRICAECRKKNNG